MPTFDHLAQREKSEQVDSIRNYPKKFSSATKHMLKNCGTICQHLLKWSGALEFEGMKREVKTLEDCV